MARRPFRGRPTRRGAVRPAVRAAALARATAQLRAAFAKARERLEKLRAQGSSAFDELWEEVYRIVNSDPPLYLGGGYRSAQEFIEKELPGETVRSVQRNVLVARSFSPEDEARHGVTFLEEVALYAKELAGASEVPRAIDLDRLRIPVREGESVRRKTGREATIDEVRRARRELRREKTGRRTASPVEAALRAVLGASRSLRGIAVRASREKASFGGVPVGALGDFARALLRAKLPSG